MRRGYLKYELKRKEKTHFKKISKDHKPLNQLHSKVSAPKRGFEKKSGQFKSNLRTNPLRGISKKDYNYSR